jgi:hypothetical protein
MVERRRYSRWAGSYPQKSPAEWLAYGHVACCVSGAEAANVIGHSRRASARSTWSVDGAS